MALEKRVDFFLTQAKSLDTSGRAIVKVGVKRLFAFGVVGLSLCNPNGALRNEDYLQV
jgi:hypothetical protein